MSKKKNKFIPELRFPEFKNEGEWEYVYGDELFEPISNKDHNSDLPILAITQEQGAVPRDMINYHVSVTDKSIESYKVVEIGDFIISLRSFQGGIEYSNYLGLCSPAYIVLRKKEDVINDFYRHYFKTYPFIQELNKNLEGIRDGKMISYTQFSEILIPKPKIKEQKKIASCLSSLDEVISAYNERLEILKDHKKGLMQNLFPKEGESIPNYRFPEFRNDGHWEKQTIGLVAKVTTGNKDTQDKVENGKYPFFVRSQTVERINSYSFDGEAILTSGDGVGVGKNFHYINGKFDFHQRVYCIYDFEKDICGQFVFMYFSHHFNERVMKMSAKNSVDSVRMSMITEMPIYVPSKKEQQKIASSLFALDEIINTQAEMIEQLKEFKKGLMQSLFPKAID